MNVHEFIALIVCSVLFFQSLPSKAEGPVLSHCFDSRNYTSGSQYESNLNKLFTSLSSQSSSKAFITDSIGEGPNQVYGLVQCKGDISLTDCQKCVNTSTISITERCPYRKEAAVRFVDCVFRYSDRNFTSQSQTQPVVYIYALLNVSNPDGFKEIIGSFMQNLAETASSSPSRFAVNVTKYEDFRNMYGVVQCTRDLSEMDCNICLHEMINRIPDYCCVRSPGVFIASLSCYVNYDRNTPFDLSLLSPPPPPPPSKPGIPALPPLPPVVDYGDGHSFDSNDTRPIGKTKKLGTVAAILVPITTAAILASIICTLLLWRKARRKKQNGNIDAPINEKLPLMNLAALKAATRNFSTANKLGEGGFGPVYKGKLLDGREVAVKRLARNSKQGLEELRSEVQLIAKLGHRNLVRLLGCCLEGKEMLLVYEYLPNGSLNGFLNDNVKRKRLDWKQRYKIIEGIARGLLYLHQESQYRIIHRDLKTSNILLDEDLNPKISDFGLARLFEESQYVGNTRNVAGTYGYMPPEYAIHGRFSTKSDVFSFGVMVLEIVTGRSISSFHNSDSNNLQEHAWRHWTRGSYFELLDRCLGNRYIESEVVRCIHIALLCIQEDTDQRPTMSSVVVMLSSYTMTLAAPLQPAFLLTSGTGRSRSDDISTGREASESEASSCTRSKAPSNNDVTISELVPR
ncbi:hypothetical protein Scep_013109 [Stephania cephalantha]|uniref:non-specific serine/threonine protein kinase n=1 Tax=Stephania cephalantha TaxID=152367 RepID=A0AAP0JGF4_9MAGN